MATTLNPYLNFNGDAKAAMEFYQSVLGGELTSSTFAEFGMSDDPADADKTMHSQLITPGGLTLMASDVPAHMGWDAGKNNFSVSLSGDDEAELTGFFNGLSAGGTIGEPLSKAPWGDSFGQFHDKFGVSWLVNIAGAAA